MHINEFGETLLYTLEFISCGVVEKNPQNESWNGWGYLASRSASKFLLNKICDGMHHSRLLLLPSTSSTSSQLAFHSMC